MRLLFDQNISFRVVKKLIDLFIGNISNKIVHEILVIAKQNEGIVSHYRKEIEESLNKSK